MSNHLRIVLGVPNGRLMLTAPMLFGAKFVTPIVTEYLQRYAEVSATCLFLDRLSLMSFPCR